jgi:TetR/AcrR family transcriptional regulator, regulator of cefoperazone and chloramphenicol sensitivity
MTSTSPGGPAFADLTARARIRDAALRLFADRGIEGVSVRDIAAAAGVSPALIRHHFGSKDGLRDACDSHAIDSLMRIKERGVGLGEYAAPDFLPSTEPTRVLLHRYLGRSMIDGSPAAAARFDGLVDLTEQWLRHEKIDVADHRAYAAVFVGSHVGLLVLYDHVQRVLGTDGGHRFTKGLLDLHSHALLDPDLAARIGAAYDRMHDGTPSTVEPRLPRAADEGAS